MQTKFEYSAGRTNNAAKIPHQKSLFVKQHENICTSKGITQKQLQHEYIALSQIEREDKPKQIQNRIQIKYCYTSQSKLKHA